VSAVVSAAGRGATGVSRFVGDLTALQRPNVSMARFNKPLIWND
jgi:hypothetical protein